MVLRRIMYTPDPTTKPPPTTQILPLPSPTLSYWLTQPSPLAHLRTTPSLPDTCDIAILGAGMSGVLTLYHILRLHPTCRVLLLDARALCSGATGRNGGHVKVKTSTLTGLATTEERNDMQRYVHGIMDELKEMMDREEGLGQECEFEIRRSFDVFQDLDEVRAVKEVVDAVRTRGEEWTRDISWIPEEFAERVTSIRGAVGAFSVAAVSMWPYKFVAGVLERMVERFDESTLNVQMDTLVTHVSANNIIKTERGDVRAGKIVFATNGWTAGVAESFAGMITPMRGMASHHVPKKSVSPHLVNTYNIHFGKTDDGSVTGVDYLNPRPDGGIVVGGGGWHFRQDRKSWWGNFDDSVHFSKEVERHWEGYMPSTFLGWGDSNAVPDMVWTGIMGATPDGKPHVGRIPSGQEEEGLKKQWILAGFNGGGMSVIPTAAKAVAKMVVADSGFDDVKHEFGLLEGFGSTVERLEKEQGI
jgi:glycine/D-amino acid oxidase-like deaminating enzyme